MSRIILSLLLVLTGTCVQAQQVTIRLTDETGETLPGLSVRLIKSGSEKVSEAAMSNVDGLVTLDIKAYPAQLEISNLGYNPFVKAIDKQPSETVQVVLTKKYTSLNEVVVTGVGRPTRLDEAVSAYKIITAADMRSMGAVTLNEALRNQMGVNISQDASLGSQINMRGQSGSNVKIMIDGLPLNGREGSNIDMGQFNLANIERVELVQGPMNVMYGSDAIGGVINLITKTNKDDWNIGANGFYESVGKYNFGISGAKAWGRNNLSLSGSRNFFEGWDPRFDTLRNPLWKPKEQYTGNLKYIYRLSEDASLTYGMDLVREDLLSKDGFPAYYNDSTKKVFDQNFITTRFINRLQLKWKTGANGYWESNNSFALYHRRTKTYRTDLSTTEKEPYSRTGDDQAVNSFKNVTSRTTYNNKSGIFDYTFGYDVNLEFASGVERIKDGNKYIGDYALFLTTNIKVIPSLTLQPAFRFIHNTSYNAPLSPSLSLLYKPLKKLQFRASYSRGFRSPSLKELYLDFHDVNHDIVGNPDLKAEYSHHFQASSGYTLFEEAKKSGNITLTGFYDDVRNQISLAKADTIQNSNAYIYSNIGRTRIFVAQLTADFVWNALRFNVGGSYTKSIETIQELDTVPSFHYFEVNGSARYDFAAWKAGIAVFYKYTGSQPIVGSIEGQSLFQGTVKSYHNIDISVDKRFWKERITWTAGVKNLADNKIISGTGTGAGIGGGGHSTGDGINLATGRTFFTSVSIQLSK